jgi:hypothetical protein
MVDAQAEASTDDNRKQHVPDLKSGSQGAQDSSVSVSQNSGNAQKEGSGNGYWDPHAQQHAGNWNHHGHAHPQLGSWGGQQWNPGTPVHIAGYAEGTFVFGGWSGDQAYYINTVTQQSVWARDLFGGMMHAPPPMHHNPSKQYGAALAAEATRKAHERKYGQPYPAQAQSGGGGGYGDGQQQQWHHHPPHAQAHHGGGGAWDPWHQHHQHHHHQQQQVCMCVCTSLETLTHDDAEHKRS